jgi:WD40 repeat protein
VAIAANGRIASASRDGKVRLWDPARIGPEWWQGLRGRRAVHRDKHLRWIRDLAVAPDFTWLALTGGGESIVRVFDAATLRTRHVLTGHTAAPIVMAVAPSGDWLASAGADGTVRIWDLATGTTRFVLSGHTDRIYDVDVSVDGRWLVTVGRDRTLRLWSTTTGQNLAVEELPTTPAAVAFAPSGDAVYTSSARGLSRFTIATS